jgi:polyhydroxyalkanoate synthesis regulator phasin
MPPKAKGGIEVKQVNYMQLGKFMINMKLLDRNDLLIKYLSYAPVYQLKRQKVSDDLRDLLHNLLTTGEVNYELGKKMSIHEKELLNDLIIRAGLKIDLKFDKKKLQEKISDIVEEFKILQGEIIAGNNNPQLISNIKNVIEKLVYHGKLTQIQANEIMEEFD